jgi:hypothetical protein
VRGRSCSAAGDADTAAVPISSVAVATCTAAVHLSTVTVQFCNATGTVRSVTVAVGIVPVQGCTARFNS